MVKIVSSIKEWKEIYNKEIKNKGSLGFIPTMGALHKGHGTLVSRAVRENDFTVCSIFVNPTQFNDKNDLSNYPKTLDADKALLESLGCNYIFLPTMDTMYPDNYRYKVIESEYSTKFCGAHRPGHFDGVLTVVLKLLNIIKCNNAYFGEKDWQQFKLISDMAQSLFLDCNIVPCKLIREDDGLAYSSRNTLLTPKERKIAPNLYRIISQKTDLEKMKNELEQLGFIVDYLEKDQDRLLAAVFLGNVRLIDNVKG